MVMRVDLFSHAIRAVADSTLVETQRRAVDARTTRRVYRPETFAAGGLSIRWRPIMNNDQVAGKADELKGKVKEEWGKVTNDPATQAKGLADQVKGKGEQTFGDVKEGVQNPKSDKP
jgi:uncharacterized protein YjbJ (UPF0337 family)